VFAFFVVTALIFLIQVTRASDNFLVLQKKYSWPQVEELSFNKGLYCLYYFSTCFFFLIGKVCSSKNVVTILQLLLDERVCSQPGTKPDVCENSFPSFKTQISCLQYEADFLSTLQTKYCSSLTTTKYFLRSFSFGIWCQTCMYKRGIS